ncbi:MAG: hypothetical protein K6E33_05000 [Lachnospiraceae bacterium]|nr:hypothetical protein [Lachnospiraceae bacterium]
MKAILIAEKPSLMREIRSAYNESRSQVPMDIDFLAQAGHLIGLVMPGDADPKYKRWSLSTLPITVDYTYHILSGKEKLVKDIKDAVHSGNYDIVIHAGDPDQEGELLVRETLEFVGNPLPVKRFWSNDITHPAIIKALNSMKDDSDYNSLYGAALTRQHADYEFGLNVTRAATVKMGEVYRLGRVKAPIIRMIVDRERAIRDFTEKTTYKKHFVYQKADFTCEKEYDEESKAMPSPVPAFCTVIEFKDQVKDTKAPKLFKLSTLQVEAHKELKFQAAKTLSVLQRLYEKQLTSYPRSDCEYISGNTNLTEIVKGAAAITSTDTALLTRGVKAVLSDKTYVNDKAIAKEGHTAIIPTGKTGSMDQDEQKLYALIARRFLAMFASPKKTRHLSAKALEGDGKDCSDVYIYKAAKTLEPGFEAVLHPGKKEKEEVLLDLVKGQKLEPVTFSPKECVSKPPARYNDGSLIKALDNPEDYRDENGSKINYQIGTPATRANIIEECVKCGYFKRVKGVFYAEPKAEFVIDKIGDTILFDVTTSGQWEQSLDNVRNGENEALEVEKKLKEQCDRVTLDIAGRDLGGGPDESAKNSVVGKCPKCGSDVIYGQYGAYCSGKCGCTMSKAFGRKLNPQQATDILAGKKVLLKGLRSRNGKNYDMYVRMVGTEPYDYVDKKGNRVQGVGIKYETSFPNNGGNGSKNRQRSGNAESTAPGGSTDTTPGDVDGTPSGDPGVENPR